MLKETAQYAGGIISAIRDIAGLSVEQTQAIRQVTQEIDKISGVVHANSATSEESAEASEELADQASILKALVRKFKIADESVEDQETDSH